MLVRAFKPISSSLVTLVMMCKTLSTPQQDAQQAQHGAQLWSSCSAHLASLAKPQLVALAAWLLLKGRQPVSEDAVGALQPVPLEPAVQLQVLDGVMQVGASCIWQVPETLGIVAGCG